jgi:imidazolonepropionase-like amidohydrolase
MTPADGWLLADDVWWGRPIGAAAMPLAGDDVAGPPVPPDAVPAGAITRRVPGTLLPGLCDAHVHSALVDLGTVRDRGIAAVWDLGGVPAAVSALRDRAATPGSRLPQITMAGPFLTAPGGYPSDRVWAPSGSCRAVRSATDAADAVAEAYDGGATLIKVTVHAGGPVLPAVTLRAIVQCAHARELPVVAHAEGPGTVAAAVDAGADLLAHTPWTEPLDHGLVRAAAEQMTWLSTLDMHGWGTPTAERATAVDNLRLFLRFGGDVRYGTDLGNGPLPPGVNVREVRALQAAGLAPGEVLDAMTGDRAGVPPCWVPGGLDLDPVRFADVLATARVVGPELRPRHS